MHGKPHWVDSVKEFNQQADTRILQGLIACFAYADRIVLKQAENGRYFAHIYMPNQDIAIVRSRNDFNDLIVAMQEVILP
jgi:uncharacterized membrane protein YobD (UPF0266 family)